ncbi:MAG TPA: FtsX-like permease family protein [Terriglobales bacterium]|nr:FtsX-like permease family protein [Terriglobales bacterium]
MMNQMIVANLRRRPMRSLVSVIAVAIEVVLILVIVGLVNGMVNDHRTRIEGMGADIVVRAGSGAVFGELSGNTMPIGIADVLARVPGVHAVAPVAYKLLPGLEAVGGIDLENFDRVSGGFHMIAGRVFRPGTHAVIVDDIEAASKHEHVGQTLTMFGEPFEVVGVFEHGVGSRVFMDRVVLDQIDGSPNKAATFYIKTDPGADQAKVVAALQKLAPAETVQSIGDYLSLFTPDRLNAALPIFQRVMISIAIAIGFLVIFLSLYTTVLERTREIGILKALGASRGYIVQVILRESELLALIGIVVGSFLGFLLWNLLGRLYPSLTMEFTWKWVAFAALIALASSVVGALYPAFKAASQDAIAALAYE